MYVLISMCSYIVKKLKKKLHSKACHREMNVQKLNYIHQIHQIIENLMWCIIEFT